MCGCQFSVAYCAVVSILIETGFLVRAPLTLSPGTAMAPLNRAVLVEEEAAVVLVVLVVLVAAMEGTAALSHTLRRRLLLASSWRLRASKSPTCCLSSLWQRETSTHHIARVPYRPCSTHRQRAHAAAVGVASHALRLCTPFLVQHASRTQLDDAACARMGVFQWTFELDEQRVASLWRFDCFNDQVPLGVWASVANVPCGVRDSPMILLPNLCRVT